MYCGNCKALENVFQFVCRLSDKGAEKVFENFSSVTTRDLSMAIPDAENNCRGLRIFLCPKLVSC